MKKEISKYLSEVVTELTQEEILSLMEIPPEASMGDLALPCFALAKTMHRNPALIAGEIKEKLEEKKEVLGIAKIETVGAYCNLYLNREMYVENCIKKLSQPNFGINPIGKGKTFCMDYSSPNIAKNFHVGHLRTTVIGNSLYKIHEKLGYDVIRINHLGDWGTQFGKLIVAYHLWSSKEQVEEKGIEELLRIYVKFDKEEKKHPELLAKAREWFVKMEQNDEEALAIWKWFKEISMVEFERVYDMLGISFDSYLGESFYRDKVPALVKELEEKNLLTESQGARVISLEEYDMPPCLITKSDGGSIYHSRDIAALLYRKKTYDFAKCLYVTGLEQSLHFKQVFKAIEVMGYDWADSLVHVPYGLVSLDGEKLSSRSGNIIYAEDILKEAIDRAGVAIEEKNPNLADKESVAKMVGIGAVIFHDLFNQRIKNVDFSWKEVLSFEGTTGPYAQYTYARAKSILRKAAVGSEAGSKEAGSKETGSKETGSKETGSKETDSKEDMETVGLENLDAPAGSDGAQLSDDATYSLIKILNAYEEIVSNAAEKYEPSIVARYIISLATAFNKFYHECPILQAEEEVKQARLTVVNMTQLILKDACGLLGMECPEEM